MSDALTQKKRDLLCRTRAQSFFRNLLQPVFSTKPGSREVMYGICVFSYLNLKRLAIFRAKEICWVECEIGNSLILVVGYQSPLNKVARYPLDIRTQIHTAIIGNKMDFIILIEKILYGRMAGNAAH